MRGEVVTGGMLSGFLVGFSGGSSRYWQTYDGETGDEAVRKLPSHTH
jgi:hypothetical protein